MDVPPGFVLVTLVIPVPTLATAVHGTTRPRSTNDAWVAVRSIAETSPVGVDTVTSPTKVNPANVVLPAERSNPTDDADTGDVTATAALPMAAAGAEPSLSCPRAPPVAGGALLRAAGDATAVGVVLGVSLGVGVTLGGVDDGSVAVDERGSASGVEAGGADVVRAVAGSDVLAGSGDELVDDGDALTSSPEAGTVPATATVAASASTVAAANAAAIRLRRPGVRPAVMDDPAPWGRTGSTGRP